MSHAAKGKRSGMSQAAKWEGSVMSRAAVEVPDLIAANFGNFANSANSSKLTLSAPQC
jgi:hypothetical protein